MTPGPEPSISAPASSASIPRLRAEDLPQTPRRLSLVFAADVLVGDAMGLVFVFSAIVVVAFWLGFGAVTDVRSSDGDRACCDGIVSSRSEGDDFWTVRASSPLGEVESFFFQEPPLAGSTIVVRGNERCSRLHLDGGHVRRIPTIAAAAFFVPFGVFLPFIWKPLRRRWRRLHLLRDGTLTRGRQASHTINDEGDWDIHTFVFSFTDDRERARTATVTTMRPGPLLDEADEALLYDDDDACLLDGLPGLLAWAALVFVPGGIFAGAWLALR